MCHPFLPSHLSLAENCIAVVSHSSFLSALFTVLKVEEGLENNNGSRDTSTEKVYFNNGEVKTLVILPSTA